MPGITSDGIRVVVTPSQSSYFAGELFTVTITFTNIRSPVEPPPTRASSHTHKRGAHSISSAPLARPPTSPGTPRSALPPVTPSRSKSKDDNPTRMGLIGRRLGPKGADELPELIEQRRKRLLAKSLSVTIASQELDDQLGEGVLAKSASFAQHSFNGIYSAPTSPRVSSPLTRSDTLPLSSNHPHARKQSVLDGQFQPEIRPPHNLYSNTPNSSSSTFSLALDPISETIPSPYPSTPAIPSPVLETPITTAPSLTTTVNAYPPPRTTRHPPEIGLGQPIGSSKYGLQVPQTSVPSSFSQSNVELVLYSYAQLTGTLSITSVPGSMPSPDQVQTLNAVRGALLKRSVIGGGSMDITSSLHQPRPPPVRRTSHTRASSFSAGLLSILSPSSLVSSSSTPLSSPAPWTAPYRVRSSSGLGPSQNGKTAPNGVGLGISSAPIEEINPEVPLPTFEVQPTMLAVDMSLSPGESRTYTYSILLPENLPPTFKGRSLKFSYELSVGTCRSGAPGSSTGGTSGNSVSRVMKVPIRVYNNVTVAGKLRPYDLLWPVGSEAKRTSLDTTGKVTETIKNPKLTNLTALPSSRDESLVDVQKYAQQLLGSLPLPSSAGANVKVPLPVLTPGTGAGYEEVERHTSMLDRAVEREDEGMLTGCREAVEILTRIPKKASYDVNKDGVKVAVLTFTKSAYRLGETVLGVVELNERIGRARVLQLTALLEAQESLPSSISPPSSARHLRRVHAEHHSSFTSSTLRTTFSLDIPSDASPAFQVRVGEHQNPRASFGGLEWKVRLCLLVAVAADSSDIGTENVRIKHLLRDGPRGEWGASWRAPSGIAPLEKPHAATAPSAPKTWAEYFTSSFLGPAEREYHDGDIEDTDEDEEGVYDGIRTDREEWVEGVKLETVECEVPIKVWPGNTAFKAMDVVFDV
ncbi:Rgp1-domain-containing protein [Infundibulicybe gibba]|nr:Rgp1-domain-containing protein [Infundibulicybe gibba]